jgi:hypothetical protein
MRSGSEGDPAGLEPATTFFALSKKGKEKERKVCEKK